MAQHNYMSLILVITFAGALCWNRFTSLRTHYQRFRKKKSGQEAKPYTDREKWLAAKLLFTRAHSKPDKGRGRGGVS